MKGEEIRSIAVADKKTVPAGCGSVPADGLDKPPC